MMSKISVQDATKITDDGPTYAVGVEHAGALIIGTQDKEGNLESTPTIGLIGEVGELGKSALTKGSAILHFNTPSSLINTVGTILMKVLSSDAIDLVLEIINNTMKVEAGISKPSAMEELLEESIDEADNHEDKMRIVSALAVATEDRKVRDEIYTEED